MLTAAGLVDVKVGGRAPAKAGDPFTVLIAFGHQGRCETRERREADEKPMNT